MLENLEKQTIDNFEVFIIGDGCPHFQELMDSREFMDWKTRMEERGIGIVSFNYEKNWGGWGYKIYNYAIDNARGEYFMFAGNDDIIESDHLEFYLSGIDGTDLDMVYYNSFVIPWGHPRFSSLEIGSIGHSEVIIRTELVKMSPRHKSSYCNDWEFIKNIIESPIKISKTDNLYKWTYYISAVTHDDGRRFDSDLVIGFD
jgi:glycosyltransferase involved in cell wall biosynthesis